MIPGSTPRAWCLALIHHDRNLAAKLLFVATERLFAIAADVQLRTKRHRSLSSYEIAST
jgi:hypothetical protein